MADNTHTASIIHDNPKVNPHGLQFTFGHLSGTTCTSSYLGYLVKVPHGALITDWWFYGSHGVPDQNLESIGWSRPKNEGSGTITHSIIKQTLLSNAQAMQPSITASVRAELLNAGLPFKISLSDDVNQRYAWIHMYYNNTASGSFDFKFGCFYVMDENTNL